MKTMRDRWSRGAAAAEFRRNAARAPHLHWTRALAAMMALAFSASGADTPAPTASAPAAAQTPPAGAPAFRPPPLTAPTRDVPVHDPVMIRENGTYYIFCTGPGISVWSSRDMKVWNREKPVFAEVPAWVTDALPAFRGRAFWAPDISYHAGKFYLYYSASAFGKNTSCIGVATNETLDPKSPKFHWEDHGNVIQSFPGQTNWNAIDPNLVEDDAGTPWLVFGSFWDGLKLAKLAPDRLHLADDPATLPTVASRKKLPSAENPPAPEGNPKDAGGNAIEAPFIFKHAGWYYFFASIDYCCRGPKSTYKMIVGRAKDVRGPYLDQSGADMAHGGGTLLLEGDANWYGVGHCGVYDFDGTDWIVFHGYDAADQGRSKLRLEKLAWDRAGWPSVVTDTGSK